MDRYPAELFPGVETRERMAPIKPALRRLLTLLPAVFLLAIVVAGCSESAQSTFDPKGPVADRQLSLFWLIFWMAAAVFIVVEGALLYSIFKYRRRSGQDDDQLPEQIHGNTKLELTWTIIPFFLLLAIAVPTYITIADQHSPPTGNKLLDMTGADNAPITVDVIGHQWWWEFRYPELGITTANQMHVPTNTVINMNLISTDVIHSFWVPKLGGKTDVIPGRDNTMWWIADEVHCCCPRC